MSLILNEKFVKQKIICLIVYHKNYCMLSPCYQKSFGERLQNNNLMIIDTWHILAFFGGKLPEDDTLINSHVDVACHVL